MTKLFPAAQHGDRATIDAPVPFTGRRFMPMNGASASNLAEYLGDSNIAACGGTWMVRPALFADGDLSKGEGSGAEAARTAREARGRRRRTSCVRHTLLHSSSSVG